MDRFCPHCGKPIKSTGSFYLHYGRPVVSSESEKQLMPKRSEIHNSRLKPKKRSIIIGVIIIVLVLTMGGWGLYQYG